MCTRVYCLLLVLVLCLMGGVPAHADDVVWDFENGNDHGFTLWSVNPPVPTPDDPTVAGDEALTGGLPDAGVAWCIGRPDQYDGFAPPVQEGDKVKADGTMEYNQAGTNHPFTFPVNARGQESYLNTYNLTQWGDQVNTAANDQIATSPPVLLGEGAVLTVWDQGGGSGTHAPELDPNPAQGYTDGSSGIAVRLSQDGSLLASVYTHGHGTLTESTLDLSAFAGQKVYIDVVDAFAGGWGWLAVDEIHITNSVDLGNRPGMAGRPFPTADATDVPLDAVLSWTPGEFAKTHDVYLGISFEDVNTASRQSPMDVLVSQGQEDATYDSAGLLDYGTTYYWRIDEVNGAPDYTIFKGNVWTFTVEPYAYPVEPVAVTASSAEVDMGPENTINGLGFNDQDQHSTDATEMWLTSGGLPAWIQYEFDKVCKLDELWVWNSNGVFERVVGFGARDVTIEYSTDGTTWTTLEGVSEFAQASGSSDYTAGIIVDFGGAMAKYVKLTINSNWGGISPQTGLSAVRFFAAPLAARGPQPADGATDMPTDVVLNWRPGREAASHTVYLGTDATAVAGGTASAVTVADHSYTPEPLALGTTYFWRIDEDGTSGTYAGDVWSFSTVPYAVLDDFEGYNDEENAGTRIYETWIDGYGTATNGSQVGSLQAPFAERTIIHGGRQSMPLTYDNTGGKISEAVRTFEVAQDWTASGIKSLSLWFSGVPENTGQLYAKINDAKVVYDGAAADLKSKQWLPWNIDLSTLGTDVSKVTKLTIGIDGASATGILYIDDMRLYPKTPELLIPVEPARTGLLAEYLFDNGAKDTSGNGYDGTFLGDARVADSHLILDGTDDAVFIPRLGGAAATYTQCTYSMWMNSATKPALSEFIGGINYDNWGEGGGIHCKLANGVANVGIWDVPGGDLNGTTVVDAGEWCHLAVSITENEVTLYLNGHVEDSRSFTTPATMILGRGCIGAYRDNGDIQRELKGQMDDVRIYSRAVSPEEMLWLAGRREPVDKPF